MGKECRPLSDDDFNNVNGGAERPWLPPGLYPAHCILREYKIDSRWGEKLYTLWQVYLSGDLEKGSSSKLYRYYNMPRDEQGKLKFGHTHSYRKDWIAANHGRRPLNWNCLPLSIFDKILCLVSVVTVQEDSTDDLTPALHYSKVARIIRPVEEGEKFERLPLPNPVKNRSKIRFN